jgi:catechol 2,3-dioxygenase-like lactoylglutathione lyase family enzyme
MRHLLFASVIAATFAVHAQESLVVAGFHHVHLNSTDPAKAVEFYTKTFPVTSKATVAGFAAIASEKIHVLFSRVASPPNAELTSPIWHFGWGSPDMAADVQMHQANGVTFVTPLSKLAQGTVFAYLRGPDGALVEINSAPSRAFVHVHLYSEHPLCAADWYVRMLGGVRRAAPRTGPCEVPYGEPREPLADVRSPAATVRFDDISLIIYPRQRPGTLESSRGHIADHIALSVADLGAALGRLEKAGVTVLQRLQPFGAGQAAMIEGPDRIAIELIELKQ